MFIALGLTFAPVDSSWAKAKPKKATTKTQKHKSGTKAAKIRSGKTQLKKAAVTAVQLDPKAEYNLIDEDALALHNALAVAPDDKQANQKLAELALRAVRSAEKALSRGDDALFAAYAGQFPKRFADSRPALESMAARGIGVADYALGVIELHGLDGAKNVDQACLRFAVAVEKGFAGARFRHAQCIEESDPARALALIREAADAGHVAANERMGRICLDAEPPDVACATAHLERAARDGRASATTLLGWMHAEGINGAPDPARAAKLYAEAARKGETSAHNNLGELYEKGRGVAKNETSAFEHYLAAAQAGFPPGQFNVGRLYAAGRGTKQNSEEARRWLEQAEKASIPQAQEILRLLAQESR
jgi:TPR repeat protein